MGILSTLFASRKTRLHRKIDRAIDQVKHGTYNFLFVRYLDTFDRDYAGLLAAAVTNTLFNEKPVGNDAEVFCNDNKAAIDEAVLNLKGEAVIGDMVSDAIQIKASLIYGHQKSGSYDMNFGKSYATLREIGFLKQQSDVSIPKLFIAKAEKYFRKSLKTVKLL